MGRQRQRPPELPAREVGREPRRRRRADVHDHVDRMAVEEPEEGLVAPVRVPDREDGGAAHGRRVYVSASRALTSSVHVKRGAGSKSPVRAAQAPDKAACLPPEGWCRTTRT